MTILNVHTYTDIFPLGLHIDTDLVRHIYNMDEDGTGDWVYEYDTVLDTYTKIGDVGDFSPLTTPFYPSTFGSSGSNLNNAGPVYYNNELWVIMQEGDAISVFSWNGTVWSLKGTFSHLSYKVRTASLFATPTALILVEGYQEFDIALPTDVGGDIEFRSSISTGGSFGSASSFSFSYVNPFISAVNRNNAHVDGRLSSEIGHYSRPVIQYSDVSETGGPSSFTQYLLEWNGSIFVETVSRNSEEGTPGGEQRILQYEGHSENFYYFLAGIGTDWSAVPLPWTGVFTDVAPDPSPSTSKIIKQTQGFDSQGEDGFTPFGSTYRVHDPLGTWTLVQGGLADEVARAHMFKFGGLFIWYVNTSGDIFTEEGFLPQQSILLVNDSVVNLDVTNSWSLF